MQKNQEQISTRIKELICPPEGIPITGGKQLPTGNQYPNDNQIDLLKHISGSATYAIDVTYMDDSGIDLCKWGVIDIDENGEEGLSKARMVKEYLAGNGIESLLAFSGNKGFHVYLYTEPIPKEVMKKALAQVKAMFPLEGELIPGDGHRCKPAPCLHQVAGNMSYLFRDRPYEENFSIDNLPKGFYEGQLAILEDITPTLANILVLFATTEQKTEENSDIEDMVPDLSQSNGDIPPCIDSLISNGGAASLGNYSLNNLTLAGFCASMGFNGKQSNNFAKIMAKNAENGPVETTKGVKDKIRHFKSIQSAPSVKDHTFNCTYLLKAKKELQFDCTDCTVRPIGLKIQNSQTDSDHKESLLLEIPIADDLLAYTIQNGMPSESIVSEIMPPVDYNSQVSKIKKSKCYIFSLLLIAIKEGVSSEASLANWLDHNASKEDQLPTFFTSEFSDEYSGPTTAFFNEFKNKIIIKFRALKSAELVDEEIFEEILARAVDRSMRYRIIRQSQTLSNNSRDLTIDIHTSSADCTHMVSKILSSSQQGAVESVESKAEHLLEYIIGNGAGRVPTPFPELNDLTGGGFANGTKTVLVSPPGGGKSTVSAQFADHAASLGIPTIFISMEMSQEHIFVNSMARAGGINSSKIISPYPEIKEKVMDMVADLAETYFKTIGKYLYIVEGSYDTNPARIATIVSKIRTDHKLSKKDPVFVVIDYLQLLNTGIEAMDSGPNETQKISELAVKVKQLARDSNVAVLALSDVTKEEQKNSNEKKELTLNSLRGSNRIAHAADTVIALYSESSQADGGKAKLDPWDIYIEKVNSSENARDFIESIKSAKENNPIGGDGATVYARMELIKNRAGQGRGSQFLMYHKAYHKFEHLTLPGQAKAEGRA